jgi:hypothetical protein
MKDLGDTHRGGKGTEHLLKVFGLKRFENMFVFRGKWMLYVRLRLLIQRAIAKILPNSETRTGTNQNSALLKLSLDLLPRGELGIGAL